MITPNFKLAVASSNGNSAEIHIEPLEKGFGHTLGNALRRVLLTNLEGAAATQVQIDGVNHQFSTLAGLQEDIIDFVLNLKGVAFEKSDEGPVTVTINQKGKKEITAADIECPAGVRVANPELHLADLTSDKAKLKAVITVDNGIGYSPAEEHATAEIGVIPVDAIYTPVTRAHYNVEATRVGRRADLDKIRLMIETNGTITPQVAVEKAAGILTAYFNQIVNPGTVEEVTTTAVAPKVEGSVDELELPVRVINALKKGGFRKLSDFVGANRTDMMKIKNLGEKSVIDIQDQLAKKGIEVK